MTVRRRTAVPLLLRGMFAVMARRSRSQNLIDFDTLDHANNWTATTADQSNIDKNSDTDKNTDFYVDHAAAGECNGNLYAVIYANLYSNGNGTTANSDLHTVVYADLHSNGNIHAIVYTDDTTGSPDCARRSA